MSNGVSIYPGLDNSLDENLQLLESASRLGMRKVFTSFHIPETDIDRFSKDVHILFEKARKLDMEIISDMSPAAQELLDISLDDLKSLSRMNITTLRLDYGFSAEDAARISNDKSGLRIQLNASSVTEVFLDELESCNADLSRIDALHNFYPREYTGLGCDFISDKTALLHKFGISTGAFVPSLEGHRRSPFHAGLPTLEMHRHLHTDLAARHLMAMGLDYIIISDSLPTYDELSAVANADNGVTTIKAHMLLQDDISSNMLSGTFHERSDAAEYAVRTQESRLRAKERGLQIAADNTSARQVGAITIDNERYGRYMGELEIIKKPLPADSRTNVAAVIPAEERFLINEIHPGDAFRFILC